MQTVQVPTPTSERYRLAKNPDAIIFADSLNALIAKSGKTQTEIARDTGIRLSSLNNYTQAISVPRVDIAHRLANYFNVSLDTLISGGTNPEVSPSVGDSDIAAALGISLKTVQAIKAISSGQRCDEYNVIDILFDDSTIQTGGSEVKVGAFDMFDDLDCALAVSAGKTVAKGVPMDFAKGIKEICKDAVTAYVGEDQFDEDAFDKAITNSGLVSDRYLWTDFDFISHNIKKAADALSGAFHLQSGLLRSDASGAMHS